MTHCFPRRAIIGVALAITGVALVSCGGDQGADDLATEQPTMSTTGTSDVAAPTTTTVAEADSATIAVSLAGGEVVGGVRTEVVPLDEAVRIEVSGDTEDEVHVHTYDLFGNVTPGEPAVIEFVADIPGVHEVELEGSHLLILELQVEP